MIKIDRSMAAMLSFLLVAIFIFAVNCKELPGGAAGLQPRKNGVPPKKNPKKPKNPKKLTTSEASLLEEIPEMRVIPETSSTSENELEGGKKLYLSAIGHMYKKPSIKSKRMRKFRPGENVSLMPFSSTTTEWVNVTNGKREGYIQGKILCEQQLCIKKQRCGIWEDTLHAQEIRVPIIQFAIANLFPLEITQLRLKGFFYYKDEFIGEGEIFVAMNYLGVKPIASGKTIFKTLKAEGYDIGPEEFLSPENPVEVELHCALEEFGYVPCGTYYIDHVNY